MAKKGGLGMGLDELFADNSSDVEIKQTLRLSAIEPNKSQPRTDFDEAALSSLADSIQQHGLLQPLLVRPIEGGMYQIVAGERRWRACRRLGMSEVPVIIRELDDSETMQIALIENLQRENLNPVEEAKGYSDLMETYGMTQDSVAKTVGKSRSVIANSLRLLRLPASVLEKLRTGDLSVGHAKMLAGLNDEELILQLAQRASGGQMSVRQLEKACNTVRTDEDKPQKERTQPQTFYTELKLSLEERLKRRVSITNDGAKSSGKLTLEFYDEDDLKTIAKLLCEEE